MQEAKKYYGGKNTKPKGFGAPELGPINQEAERIIRGMKRQSGSRFKKLYGKRDKDVMTLTANKLALKDNLKVMYYKDFIDLVEGNPTTRMLTKSKTQTTGNISADRGTDEKKNRASRKSLEKDLKKKGIGYKKGVGEYKYSSGEGTGREVSYQTSPGKGMSKRRFGKVMRRLGRKHGQESVITKKGDKPARLHDTENKKPDKSMTLGKSKPGKNPSGMGETSGTKVRSGKLSKKTNKPAIHYGK